MKRAIAVLAAVTVAVSGCGALPGDLGKLTDMVSQKTDSGENAAQEEETEAKQNAGESQAETSALSESEALQAELLAQYAKDKYIGECTDVDYKEYFRYAENHTDTKVRAKVSIDKVSDKDLSCSAGDEEYLIHDQREDGQGHLMAGDEICVYGEFAGLEKASGTTASGNDQVLAINAKYIDLLDPDTETQAAAAAPAETAAPTTAAAVQQPEAYTGGYDTLYVVNCRQSITLRTSPSTKAAEIRQIPLGASVSYVGMAENGFYKVIYLSDTGYALASYLSSTKPAYQATQPQPQVQQPAYSTMRVVNCRESITLRTSPSTKAAEIRQIPLGAVVSYVENAANGFYKVTYLGSTGYALASYLEFD